MGIKARDSTWLTQTSTPLLAATIILRISQYDLKANECTGVAFLWPLAILDSLNLAPVFPF